MAAYILVMVLILVVCVLLGLIVLVQNPKGGGLVSNFSSSNQFMGVRKTADFLEKASWTLALALLVFSLISIFVIPRNIRSSEVPQSEIQQRAQEGTGGAPVDYQAPPEE
ncbi:MAG TPA: preprotein translocase subunit SecG [Bacteroidales bacterium]|nr:preprotein translocase subunit SecG [Bacteroidales bacterium]HNS45874.1 preprotein translocase subunit SecG [Bacteroidales bacterium]